MGRYIKYIREENIFKDPNYGLMLTDIQNYLDTIIERGFEIINYDEEIICDTLDFSQKIKIVVLLGKWNKY